MQLRWPAFVLSLSALLPSSTSDVRRKYELEPAPEFLFERRPFRSECADRTPTRNGITERGAQAVLVPGNQAPYLLTRPEEVTLSRADIPALTITADPSSFVAVGGSSRSDWSVHFCAQGDGQNEAEAREHLQKISMTRLGSTLSLNGPRLGERPQARGFLVVGAPADAPLVIHTSFAAVEIRDMASPVRVAATHARVTILDTTGQVDANAMVVDFAGSRGQVTLSAEAEINLKMTTAQFEGTLSAWAQQSVRILVPPGFITPFQAMVNRPQDFVCRAEFCSKVKQEKKGGLHIFTYGGDSATAPEPVLQLRSEQATVVIDGTDRKKSDRL
jgi:hypothetical protein